MTIQASCGHEVEFDTEYRISVKAYNPDWSRCVQFISVCESCYHTYREDGDILDTEEDMREWIENGEE